MARSLKKSLIFCGFPKENSNTASFKFKRSFDILKTARIGLAVKKRELFIPCHCMEGGVVLTIDPRWVWLRSVWRFEIQFVIVPLDKVLNVEKMLKYQV